MEDKFFVFFSKDKRNYISFLYIFLLNTYKKILEFDAYAYINIIITSKGNLRFLKIYYDKLFKSS